MGCGASASTRYAEDNQAAPVHTNPNQVAPLNRDQVTHRCVAEATTYRERSASQNVGVMDVIKAKEGSRPQFDRHRPGPIEWTQSVTVASCQSLQKPRANEDTRKRSKSPSPSSNSASSHRLTDDDIARSEGGSKERYQRSKSKESVTSQERHRLSQDDVVPQREDVPYRRPSQKGVNSTLAPPVSSDDVVPKREDVPYRRPSKSPRNASKSPRNAPLDSEEMCIPEGVSRVYEATTLQRKNSHLNDHAGAQPIGKENVGVSRLQEGAEALENCKRAAQVDKAQAGSVQKNWSKARSASLLLAHQNEVLGNKSGSRVSVTQSRDSLKSCDEEARQDARRGIQRCANGDVLAVQGGGQVDFVEGLQDPKSNQPWQQGDQMRTGWKTKRNTQNF